MNFGRGMVVMLHGLAVQVFAEGVVEPADARALWKCGVDGITGPWAKPNVSVDLAAIAKNPQAVLDTVKKALGNVKGGSQVQDAIGKLAGSKEGKAIGDLLGGLLGKGAAPTDQPAQ